MNFFRAVISDVKAFRYSVWLYNTEHGDFYWRGCDSAAQAEEIANHLNRNFRTAKLELHPVRLVNEEEIA